MLELSKNQVRRIGLMLKSKLERVSFLIFVLLLSGCTQSKIQPHVSQIQPHVRKVLEKKKIIIMTPIPISTPTVYKEIEPKEQINLTKLSLNTQQVSIQEENWMPLKVEDEIEWNAKELLGHKYVWGATGPYNYDCSGFTQKIFRDVGIYLPRVSRDQSKKGQYVSFDELVKGDLVFFATKRRHPNRVTHVGIYLGNGNFIHASSGVKKVVIFNFNQKEYYKKHFLWGRRVIQDNNHIASAI